MSGRHRVGYGNPPKARQFKPGVSGNPLGRPKGRKNLKTEFVAEMGERISVRENGKMSRLTKQKALLKALVAKGLQGDVKAINAILLLNARLVDENVSTDELTLDRDEQLLIRKFAPQALRQLKTRRDR